MPDDSAISSDDKLDELHELLVGTVTRRGGWTIRRSATVVQARRP